jgi:putative ABC transport system permease protein
MKQKLPPAWQESKKMLNPRWYKVIRDLFSNKTRTILVVLAIAVGIFAFGSVYITEDVLVADMNAEYAAIHPYTISFSVRETDTSLLTWAERQHEITQAEMRSINSIKLINGKDEQDMTVYTYPDFSDIKLNQLIPASGSWPPGKGEILLERSSLGKDAAKTGDNLILETTDGRKHSIVFGGTVHDMNAIPATMSHQLSGYISDRTVTGLGLPLVYNRLDITALPEYDTKAKLEILADDLQKRLKRDGVNVYSAEIRTPGEHWARPTTSSFSLILSVIGIFSLILSGFLVVNTVSSLLAEQRKQIGIMKATGGSIGQIAGIYLALVTCYGALALILAVPVGMGLGYVFTSAVANLINIDIINFRLPLYVLLMQAGAAIVIPTIASAIPILGSTRSSIREALSDYGIKNKENRDIMSRSLARVSFLTGPLQVALRNIFRKKARLSLTLGTLIIAGALFVTVSNVGGSLSAMLDGILSTEFNFEAALSLDGPYSRSGLETRAERLTGIVKAEGWSGISTQLVKADGSKGETFSVTGLPYDSDFVHPEPLEGRWFKEDEREAIVLSGKLANEMPGVSPGSTVTLLTNGVERKWQVVGIARAALDRIGYADFNYVSKLSGAPGSATGLVIRTQSKDSASQTEMAAKVEEELKKSGIGVTSSITKDWIVSANKSSFDFLVAFLMSMAAMTALIGALGLAGMMSLNVMERTREIGIMRSIGASNGAIAGIVLIEGLLIGIISWAVALPLSLPFSFAFNSMLGNTLVEYPLALVFSPSSVVLWLVIMIVISVLASLLPAYRAMRMSIRDTLAYE